MAPVECRMRSSHLARVSALLVNRSPREWHQWQHPAGGQAAAILAARTAAGLRPRKQEEEEAPSALASAAPSMAPSDEKVATAGSSFAVTC